jgi:large subunit ribosomal protein L24
MRRTHNTIPKLHIKKGDTVKVLSGRDRGATGRVLRVLPEDRKAIVEGVNIVTKHVKPNQQSPNGSRVEQEAPIYTCKLQLIDPKSGKPTRIGRTKTDNGWKRVAKVSGELID